MSEYIYPPPSSLPPGSAVIAYLRDSGGPNQDQSIGQQERVILDYCSNNGFVLLRVYSDTASGRKTKNRDQFLEMFNTMMTCPDELRPRGLLLWAFSRFSRDIVDFNYYLYGLLKKGMAVCSLTEPIPDGIAGQIMLSVKAYTNADYSIQLGKHIKRGIADMVSAGYSNGGLPPIGYRAVRDYKGLRRNGQERTGIKWELDPELSPLVLLAWQMRADGKSYGEITEATGGRIYKNKNSWASHFKNRSYLGIGKAGDLEIPNHHDPIITPDLWDAVKNLEKKRAQALHHRRIKHPSLLGGIAFCIYCGAAMTLHTQKDYRSYACGQRERQRGYKDCSQARRVNAPKVERLVLDTVLNRVLSSEQANRTIEEIQNQMVDTGAIDREIGTVNNLLITTERSIARLLALAEGAGNIEEISVRLVHLKREKSELEARMKALKAQRDIESPKITPASLALVYDELRSQVQAAASSGDILTAKKAISRFVKKIELSNKKCIIHYILPFEIPADATNGLSAHNPDQ